MLNLFFLYERDREAFARKLRYKVGIEMQDLKVLRVLQPTEEALDARHEEKLVAEADVVVWYKAYLFMSL